MAEAFLWFYLGGLAVMASVTMLDPVEGMDEDEDLLFSVAMALFWPVTLIFVFIRHFLGWNEEDADAGN